MIQVGSAISGESIVHIKRDVGRGTHIDKKNRKRQHYSETDKDEGRKSIICADRYSQREHKTDKESFR